MAVYLDSYQILAHQIVCWVSPMILPYFIRVSRCFNFNVYREMHGGAPTVTSKVGGQESRPCTGAGAWLTAQATPKQLGYFATSI